MDTGAMAEKAAGKHPRVVQYEAVAGVKKLRQVAKGPVLPALACAVKHEHARARAVGQWLLCDQIWREVVGEIGKSHKATGSGHSRPHPEC